VSRPAASLFQDSERHLFSAGLAEDTPRDGVLAVVTAARITPDARHVVVLDAVPPFVKVFDGEGKLYSAFLRKGGGPGEATFPTALATLGDSLILIADVSQRLSVYDLRGKLVSAISGAGILPLAAVGGCDDQWLVYGPRTQAAAPYRRGEASWLHRIPQGATRADQVSSFFQDSMPPGRIGLGLPYGLVVDGTTAVLRHEHGDVPSLVSWSCGESEPRVRPLPGAIRRSVDEANGSERGTKTIHIRPGNRSQAGVAAVEAGVVVSDFVAVGNGADYTELRLVGTEGVRAVRIPGVYVLRDSRAGVGVLVGAVEPVPHLFMVREADLMALFEDPAAE
jgi:hypothetical protein